MNDLGHSFVIEIDPNMELENVMALLEAESGIPVNEQSISYEGRDLSNPKATMRECGVGDHAMLLLRRKVSVAGRTLEQDAEMMRLQLLGDPELMRQLQATQPEVAHAAQNDPARFAELLRQTRARHLETDAALETMNADPFDIEAQRRIEEAIRQQAVLENLEHALEYSPESFGRVTMLYVPVEVNGHPVKAFVDSGAQQTIMSPDLAEQCGLMRLLDKRFSGIARGVGTAKILGRIHSAQLKLADLFLPCSFTVMEGRDVDFLFGLDMLKAHQACIDLEKNVLRIRGREVSFLAEHELPEKARLFEAPNPEDVAAAAGSHATLPSGSASSPAQPSFPGSGHTLGSAPRPGQGRGAPAAVAQGSQSRHSEQDINTLMNLGVSREVAISTLDAAGGNVEYAASLLF